MHCHLPSHECNLLLLSCCVLIPSFSPFSLPRFPFLILFALLPYSIFIAISPVLVIRLHECSLLLLSCCVLIPSFFPVSLSLFPFLIVFALLPCSIFTVISPSLILCLYECSLLLFLLYFISHSVFFPFLSVPLCRF